MSDGESDRYTPEAIVTQFQPAHVRLLAVRFWNADERVYSRGGKERYRPDPASLPLLQRLTMASTHRHVFSEWNTAGVLRTARSLLGHGSAVTVGQPKRLELAPYAALAALVPLAFVLRRRDG